MMMHTSPTRWRIAAIAAAVVTASLAGGCRDRTQATVYEVREDVPAAESPAGAAAQAAASAPASKGLNAMARQALPENALNRSSGNPDWSVPAGWTEVAASSMRRASFRAGEGDAAVDIAVTSFPGDVGGLLANVNRWRGQLGLPPVAAAELESMIQRSQAHGKPVILVYLENGPQAMQTATYEHAGNSWFIRMAGPTASVRAQREAFVTFAHSVSFENLP